MATATLASVASMPGEMATDQLEAPSMHMDTAERRQSSSEVAAFVA